MNLQDMVKNIILKGVEYSGNREPYRKAISASELNNDILQIWLRQKYGVIQNKDFNLMTLGSLIHRGLEEIFKNENGFKAEVELDPVELSNGWKLTGTADLVLMSDEENAIIDIKLTKSTIVSKLNKENQYELQLNAYRYMAEKQFGKQFNMYLLLLFKDAGWDYKNGQTIPAFQIYPVDKIPDKALLDQINAKAERVEKFIQLDAIPPQCDTWGEIYRPEKLPHRCHIYCQWSDLGLCPYYTKKKRNSLKTKGVIF